MSTTCIEACELTKSFNGQKVVDGLSFSVEKGQVFAIAVICSIISVKTFRWE